MKSAAPYLARSKTSRHEHHRKPARQQELAAGDLRRALGGSQKAHDHLVEAILTWCELHRMPATEIYTGPRVRPRPGGGWDLRRNRSNVGISDVVTVIAPIGRLVLIEAKTGAARRTPEQRAIHERYSAAGALCVTVRDIGRDLAVIERARAEARVLFDRELRALGGGGA